MAEYIKREAAIAALNKVRDDQRVFKYATASDFLSARDAIERAIKVLESLPAADVEPVKRGRWVPKPFGVTYIWRCSKCETIGNPQWNYCHKCGARMDEG